METNVVEKIEENGTVKKEQTKNKKVFTIMGLSIWRILAYFIIYSFAGYVIETLFGLFTKGVIESRKSFLYGPFCCIYGLGAVIILIFLHKYDKKYNSLFFGGFLLGSIVEYIISWFGEVFLNMKWWDYSDMPLNINGRICVYFSIFWGFLSIYLVASLNPKIDKIIEWFKKKINLKALKILTISTIIFLAVDCIISIIASHFFLIRMIAENDIDVENKEAVIEEYNEIYSNEKLSQFIYKHWGDKKIILAWPNMKVNDTKGDIILINTYLPDIQPYYLKVHRPRKIDLEKYKSKDVDE